MSIFTSCLDPYTILVGATVFLLSYWLYQRLTDPVRKSKFPTGPRPVPIFGNLLPFYKNYSIHLLLTDWSKEYGDIYTVWFGSQPVVVLNRHDLIKEAFISKGDQCSNRLPVNWIRKLLQARAGEWRCMIT